MFLQAASGTEQKMCIALEKYKIAYSPVPTAACTEVKAALAMIDDQDQLALPDILKKPLLVHKLYATRRFRLDRLGAYEDEGWWRFAVIRDPLKRLLSFYAQRVLGQRELHNSKRLKQQTKLPLDPDPDCFFQNIEDYRDLSSTVKHHVLPSHLFIGPRHDWYDRIYRIEEIQMLQSDLEKRIGAIVRIPSITRQGRSLSLSYLNGKTIDALNAFLRPEYERLKAYYPNPF